MTSSSAQQGRLQRIVLTGFMGSGKTTVGRILAERLHWQFADLDDCVERREARTVPQIFAEHGEAAFRVAETAALAELLREANIVIALGGGAPGTAAVRSLLAATPGTGVVHLDAPFPVLYDRCASQALDPEATARPLWGERDAAHERFRQRSGLYAAVAQHTVDASLSAPNLVAESILRDLVPALEFGD